MGFESFDSVFNTKSSFVSGFKCRPYFKTVETSLRYQSQSLSGVRQVMCQTRGKVSLSSMKDAHKIYHDPKMVNLTAEDEMSTPYSPTPKEKLRQKS